MASALSVLDVTIVVAAVMSAWFWLQAAGKPQRRVSKFEDFNHADLNRLATALNRARVLNARAALESQHGHILVNGPPMRCISTSGAGVAGPAPGVYRRVVRI